MRDNWIKSLIYALTFEATNVYKELDIAVEESQNSMDQIVLTSRDSLDLLRNSELDLAIVFYCESFDWHDMEVISLHDEPFTIFISENSRVFNKKEPYNLIDLKDENFVFSTAYPAYSQRFAEICAASGFTANLQYRYGKSFGDIVIAKNSSEAFVIGDSAKDRVLPKNISHLIEVPIDDENMHYRICLVYMKDSKNRGIDNFVSLLDDIVPKMGGTAYRAPLPNSGAEPPLFL